MRMHPIGRFFLFPAKCSLLCHGKCDRQPAGNQPSLIQITYTSFGFLIVNPG
jgi:hypothetical protein